MRLLIVLVLLYALVQFSQGANELCIRCRCRDRILRCRGKSLTILLGLRPQPRFTQVDLQLCTLPRMDYHIDMQHLFPNMELLDIRNTDGICNTVNNIKEGTNVLTDCNLSGPVEITSMKTAHISFPSSASPVSSLGFSSKEETNYDAVTSETSFNRKTDATSTSSLDRREEITSLPPLPKHQFTTDVSTHLNDERIRSTETITEIPVTSLTTLLENDVSTTLLFSSEKSLIQSETSDTPDIMNQSSNTEGTSLVTTTIAVLVSMGVSLTVTGFITGLIAFYLVRRRNHNLLREGYIELDELNPFPGRRHSAPTISILSDIDPSMDRSLSAPAGLMSLDTMLTESTDLESIDLGQNDFQNARLEAVLGDDEYDAPGNRFL